VTLDELERFPRDGFRAPVPHLLRSSSRCDAALDAAALFRKIAGQ